MIRELKNAVFSFNFVIAILITAFAFYLGLADTNILKTPQSYNILYLFNICMQISPLFVFLPFIATLPYGYRFIDEYNSTYFRFSLSRSGYSRYARNKTTAVGVSAFLAVFAGISVCVAFLSVFAKPIDLSDYETKQLLVTLCENRTYGKLLNINPYLYISVYTFFISLFASLWPCIGMISSTYIKNRYISLVMPFAIFFLLWQIGGRVVYLLPSISRFFVLSNIYYGNYGLFENPLLSCCITLIFVTIWNFLLFLWFRKRIKV